MVSHVQPSASLFCTQQTVVYIYMPFYSINQLCLHFSLVQTYVVAARKEPMPVVERWFQPDGRPSSSWPCVTYQSDVYVCSPLLDYLGPCQGISAWCQTDEAADDQDDDDDKCARAKSMQCSVESVSQVQVQRCVFQLNFNPVLQLSTFQTETQWLPTLERQKEER